MKKMSFDFLMAFVLILISTASRMVPHAWNVTLVGACSFVAVLAFGRRQSLGAFVIPIISLFLSDLVIGFHNTIFFVYAGFLLAQIPFFFILPDGQKAKTESATESLFKIVPAAVVASLIFFFVSNAGVWIQSGFYSKDLQGLATCLAMGIPFYKLQFLTDVVATVVLYSVVFVLNSKLSLYGLSRTTTDHNSPY